jgi:hypothetical protein
MSVSPSRDTVSSPPSSVTGSTISSDAVTISYARARHPPVLFVDSTSDQQVCLDGFREMKARLAEVGSPDVVCRSPT